MVDLEKIIVERNTPNELHLRSHPKETIELFFMIPFLSAMVAAELVIRILEPLQIAIAVGVWAMFFYLFYNFTTDRIIITKKHVQFQKWFIYPFKFTIDYYSCNRQDDCSLMFSQKGKPVLELASYNQNSYDDSDLCLIFHLRFRFRLSLGYKDCGTELWNKIEQWLQESSRIGS